MRSNRMVMLAVTARANRIGYVLLIDAVVKDWRISRTGCQNTKSAAVAIQSWINTFDPEIVVLENHKSAGRKSRKTIAIIKALNRTARKTVAITSPVNRVQQYPNKFVEAKAIADRFPELEAWVPKRPKLWQREPRNLIYFEALALALQSGFLPEES